MGGTRASASQLPRPMNATAPPESLFDVVTCVLCDATVTDAACPGAGSRASSAALSQCTVGSLAVAPAALAFAFAAPFLVADALSDRKERRVGYRGGALLAGRCPWLLRSSLSLLLGLAPLVALALLPSRDVHVGTWAWAVCSAAAWLANSVVCFLRRKLGPHQTPDYAAAFYALSLLAEAGFAVLAVRELLQDRGLSVLDWTAVLRAALMLPIGLPALVDTAVSVCRARRGSGRGAAGDDVCEDGVGAHRNLGHARDGAAQPLLGASTAAYGSMEEPLMAGAATAGAPADAWVDATAQVKGSEALTWSPSAVVWSPEERAGCWSRLTFTWMQRLLGAGYRRPLEPRDLPVLGVQDGTKHLHDLFERAWQRELEREAAGGAASLWRALAAAHGRSVLAGALMKLVFDTLSVAVGPVVLQALVTYLSADSGGSAAVGYGLAGVLFGTALLQTLVLHAYFLRVFRAGQHLRSTVIAAVFFKALRLSGEASSSRGKLLNLASVDAKRLQSLTSYLVMVMSAPIAAVA